MFCPPKIKIDHKIIIGALIGLAVIGGLGAWLMRYFEAFSDVSQVANKNPNQKQAADLAQLSEDYLTASARIISDFLTAAESNPANAGALAQQAQKSLLALSLPAQFQQKHLSEVLLLGKIIDSAAAGQTAIVAEKISELRQASAN